MDTTMAMLDDILPAYAELEANVGRLMARLFGETCGLCTACCCRVDICEEAQESAFLSRLLRMQGRTGGELDERLGWLDLHGCSLKHGRPPICYAYFCDELLARLPNDDTRFAVRILGNLMDHIGQQALDGLHLVEIRNESDLERVDCERLAQRLNEARDAFEALVAFLEGGRLDAATRMHLETISSDAP